MLQVETHGLVPGTACTYTLDIASQDGAAADSLSAVTEAALPPARPLPSGSAWYRGDLHTHTVHSDGHVPVAGRVAAAEARGLDFFFLTDHNTVSGLVELDRMSSPRVLPARGMELTTFWGHALCLGGSEWVEWRAEPGTGRWLRLPRRKLRAACSSSRTRAIDDPYCTGCGGTTTTDARPGACGGGVERPVGRRFGQQENLALWYGWLNAGCASWQPRTDTHDFYPEGG